MPRLPGRGRFRTAFQVSSSVLYPFCVHLIADTVNRRAQEMAIRMALGAGRSDLLYLVLQEGLWVTLSGVVLGLAGALILSRLMAGYVYGISSADPLTFARASLLLAAVALLASCLQARRSARVDPEVTLRYE